MQGCAANICALIALASALCRSADGQSIFPAAVELAIECAAALSWLYAKRKTSNDNQKTAGTTLQIPTFVLTALVSVVFAFIESRPILVGIAATAFIVTSQLLEHIVRIYNRIAQSIDAPRQVVALVLKPWLVMIALEAILLALPIATQSGVPDYRHNFLNHALDSLFASTSAACLSGVTIRSFGEDYTFFGQCIMVGMTHLSGMAFALIGLAIVRPFLWRAISPRTTLLTAWVIQAIAIVVMSPAWHDTDAALLTDRLWWSIVHAGSAIWNTGLMLRTDGLAPYFTDFRISIAVTTLAIIGSLGLPFLIELILPQPKSAEEPSDDASSHARRRLRKLPEFEALAATILLGMGAVMLWYFDHPATKVASWAPTRSLESVEDRIALNDIPPEQRWPVGLFVSATLRSTGMQSTTISAGSLSWCTFGLMLSWMLIGGSAAGVAAGGRTTMFTLPLVLLRWKQEKSELRFRLLKRLAIFIAVIVAGNIFAVFILNLVTDATPYEVALEAIAAVNNVGLSSGLSLHLTPVGRLVMIGLFIAGRLGPIVFWVSIADLVRKSTIRTTHQAA